jgi:hypothetical protein
MRSVDLGISARLVFPREGIAFTRGPSGLWAREGMAIPDSVRITAGITNVGFVDGEEQDILEDWFAGTARPNTPSHIGLFTTTPNDAGGAGVEVSGGSYAREALARNGTNWGSSAAADPSTIQSLVVVTFTQATANWGTILSWGYFDAVSAGTLLFFAALDTSKAVNSGDTAQFAAGGLVAKLGDPGDSY